MSENRSQRILRQTREALCREGALNERLQWAAKEIAGELDLDIVVISAAIEGQYARIPSSPQLERTIPLELLDGRIVCDGDPVGLPLIAHDIERTRQRAIQQEGKLRAIRSLLIFGLELESEVYGTIEFYSFARYRRWSQEEIDIIGSLVQLLTLSLREGSLQSAAPRLSSLDEARIQYQRLARYGNIIVMFTDRHFSIVDVIGNPEKLFGLSETELKRDRIVWDTLIHPQDRVVLMRRLRRAELERNEVREEIRIIHQRSGEVRWIMLRALPQFGSSGEFVGWEGFGIDTTERRKAEDSYRSEARRVEALLEVSRALQQGQDDPSKVALRGLRAIIRATGCACGFVVFKNQQTLALELVSSVGFRAEFLEELEPVLSGASLLRHAINSQESVLVTNIQHDPRAQRELAAKENLRSSIVAPLSIDGQVYGAFSLYFRESGAFTQADLDLVTAAATQISLTLKNSISRDSERGLMRSLQALYRISHEVSKYRTPREMSEALLPVLHEEFNLKRIWFGVLNDQGTHVVGQGAYGPGLRKEHGEIQLELADRHELFDEAIKERRAVVIDPSEPIECSGLEGLMARLALGRFVVFPLVSANQVVGVMIVEPNSPEVFLTPRIQELVLSVASEIATVVVARRFESKLAEAVKMRMAGLLASGVAHNFNNILQAVLGQVALIEMQLPTNSPALESTKEISLAAKRGGGLVSQLLTFATPTPASKSQLDLREMISESKDLYESLIGRRTTIEYDLEPDCPEVVADHQLIQQVVTNLIANAKDAVSNKQNPKITLSLKRVRVGLREVDPELPPGLYVRIDIADNGQGMTPESASRCFEPFFTTKNVDAGTGLGISGSGLGLSSAYSIARQHEGTITVHTVPGEGSVFSVYLPVIALRTGSKVDGARQAMCVGFERGVEPLVLDLFESLGLAAETSYDISLALGELKRSPQSFEVLAIDVDRIGASAEEEMRALAKSYPDRSLLLFSANSASWSARSMPRNVQVLDKPPALWGVSEALNRTKQLSI